MQRVRHAAMRMDMADIEFHPRPTEPAAFDVERLRVLLAQFALEGTMKRLGGTARADAEELDFDADRGGETGVGRDDGSQWGQDADLRHP